MGDTLTNNHYSITFLNLISSPFLPDSTSRPTATYENMVYHAGAKHVGPPLGFNLQNQRNLIEKKKKKKKKTTHTPNKK